MTSRVARVAIAVALVATGIWVAGCRRSPVEQRVTAAELDERRFDTEAALLEYEAALAEARAGGDPGQEARILMRIAGLHHREGRYDEARDLYDEAQSAYERAGDYDGVAAVLHEKGATYMVAGQYQEAQFYYRKALALRLQLGDLDGQAATYNEIGSVYLRTDYPQLALTFYEEALRIRNRLRDTRGVAECTQNIGAVYHAELRDELVYGGEQPDLRKEQEEARKDWRKYRHDKALENYERAMTLYKRLGELPKVATLYYEIGTVWILPFMRDCEKARENLFKALDLREELGDEVGIAWCYHSIGSSYHVEVVADEALRWYHMARDKWIELNNKTAEATTIHEIGGVYQLIGVYDEAIRWYKIALKMRQEELLDEHLAAFTFYEMGQTYRKAGMAAEAIAAYVSGLERALDYHDIHIEAGCVEGLRLLGAYDQIAAVYSRKGQPQDAIEWLLKALKVRRDELKDPRLVGFTMAQLGDAYRQAGDNAKAAEYYTQGLEYAGTLSDADLRAKCEQGLRAVGAAPSTSEPAQQ